MYCRYIEVNLNAFDLFRLLDTVKFEAEQGFRELNSNRFSLTVVYNYLVYSCCVDLAVLKLRKYCV